MGEIEVSPGNHVNYEEWLKSHQAQKRRTTVTDEMFPVKNISEVSFPRDADPDAEELDILGGSTHWVDIALDEAKEARTRPKKLICVCGHSEGAHEQFRDMDTCCPARQFCRCQKMVLVLRVENARYFMHSSDGSGPLHALTKGIRSMQKNGFTGELVVPKKCFRCGAATSRLIPLMLTKDGLPTHSVGPYTILACESCVEDSGLTMTYEPLR